jgi:aryl-alcohol dehydrogenase-like predicted oxidoreductase
MEYRYIEKSGLRVSAISLGTMNFGATTNEKTAKMIIDVARDQGVNFIDTADAYVSGESEKILGKLIKKDRNDWVVATKVGQQDGTFKKMDDGGHRQFTQTSASGPRGIILYASCRLGYASARKCGGHGKDYCKR